MLLRLLSWRPAPPLISDPVQSGYYFMGLQTGFILSLQNGETLGYAVRTEQ